MRENFPVYVFTYMAKKSRIREIGRNRIDFFARRSRSCRPI